jgi:tRNA-dihydrouridine synthase A
MGWRDLPEPGDPNALGSRWRDDGTRFGKRGRLSYTSPRQHAGYGSRELTAQQKIIAVAPMMEWTDRHCRYLHRLLSRHARLYTEMVTADAVLRGDRERLIGFDPAEHPVALQLGGSDPAKLAEAARIGADFGYDEINLNVGCPSDRVQSGRFGACLMREPELVAACAAAMRAAVSIAVTVKCRIGVDNQDPEVALHTLIGACKRAGVGLFAVHARKAWLEGLSPKENREIPPLDYDLVYTIRREHPDLTIVVNGGIANLDDAEGHLAHVDGVMIGRAAYHSPAILAEVDARLFGGQASDIDDVTERYVAYVERQLRNGTPLNAMTKHLLGLFNGRPGARAFRRHLSENATRPSAGAKVLREALGHLQREQERVAA